MSDDAITVLEDELKKQQAEEAGAKALSSARSRLVLGKDAACAFFATLALRLEVIPSWDVPTAAVDGKHLYYNPEFFSKLSAEEAKGVVCHEVLHCAQGHMSRLGHRDPPRGNVAMDLAINPLVCDAGMRLPQGALWPGQRPGPNCPPAWADAIAKMPEGLAFEEYYNLLPALPTEEEGGRGDGDEDAPPQQGQDPGGCGASLPAGDPAQQRQAEADWKCAVAQAEAVARQRGTLPGGLSRLVGELLAPRVDWKEILREFISRHARNDYAWSPPNRRFVWQGLYLPGLRSEELGDVVLLVDTSGSIGATELTRFASEIQGILEAYDCQLHILYHDTAVAGVQEWSSSDGPLVLEPRGGGGTSHVQAFEQVEKDYPEAACVVALTDLCTQFPKPPCLPTLWATVGAKGQKAPFGVTVEVD